MNISLETIEKYFDSLNEKDFKDEMTVKNIAKEIKALNDTKEKTISTDRASTKSIIFDGNLNIVINKNVEVFENLIVTGDLWIQSNELKITKNLIVGGNLYLQLDNLIGAGTYDLVNQEYLDKICFFVGGSIISKSKTNLDFDFGVAYLTVCGESYIAGNCYFNNGNCNFYNKVTIDSDLITKSLLLCNCDKVNLNGKVAILKEIKTVGNNTILAKKNFLYKDCTEIYGKSLYINPLI